MKPWLKILIGLVLGVITGLILNKQVEILSMVGKAFIDLLKMLVPAVICNIKRPDHNVHSEVE